MYTQWIKVMDLPNPENYPEHMERVAGLFMLEKPILTIHGWNDVFVVSRIHREFGNYETMIFAATDDGTVLNYMRPQHTHVESSFFMGLEHVLSHWLYEEDNWMMLHN